MDELPEGGCGHERRRTVAAALEGRGHEVIGVHMKPWQDNLKQTMPLHRTSDDASAVCRVLGIHSIWISRRNSRSSGGLLAEYPGRTLIPAVCNRS
jgi:tRNA U34 2-thiouridine synthase MnmA/TrmU